MKTHCPNCGHDVDASLGQTSCSECGAKLAQEDPPSSQLFSPAPKTSRPSEFFSGVVVLAVIALGVWLLSLIFPSTFWSGRKEAIRDKAQQEHDFDYTTLHPFRHSPSYKKEPTRPYDLSEPAKGMELQSRILHTEAEAMQGDAEAQYELATLYAGGYHQGGVGVKMDLVKAFQWCEKAAIKGHADAQYMLGLCYDAGKGVPEDATKAVEWFQKAAQSGNPEAQLNMGTRFEMGLGVPKSETVAFEWIEKAAKQGLAEAQFVISMKYLKGILVSKDVHKSLWWAQKAADQQHASAQHLMGLIFAAEEDAPKDDAKAFECFKRAAKQGLAEAQYKLGFHYHLGEGVPVDDVQAYAWVSLANAQNYPNAWVLQKEIDKHLTPRQKAEAQRLVAEILLNMPHPSPKSP